MEWETWQSIIDACIENGHYSPCVVKEFLNELNSKFCFKFGVIDMYTYFTAMEYIRQFYSKSSCPGKMGCQIVSEHQYYKGTNYD